MASHYFAETIEFDKVEPRHKLCAQFDLVTLQQRWRDTVAGINRERAKLEEAAQRWRDAVPGADITLGGTEATAAAFRLHTARGYLNGRIYSDGGFYVDRMSALDEATALDLVKFFRGEVR